MESPDNGRDRAPIRHLSPPKENPSARNGLHLIKLLVKEAPWNPQTTHVISKAFDCSPESGGKTLLLKTILLNMEKSRNPHPYRPGFMVL